ncbi:MAG: thiamine phosphate synthase [bacterium]|nr:thiamine phosphate synthase [bacterium]
MFKIIAVSNRRLCSGGFVQRIKEITSAGTEVILREKDLSPKEYAQLLDKAGHKNIIPHSFYEQARNAGHKKLHLPLRMLSENPQLAEEFRVGVSIHSPEEAAEAQRLGAAYVTAGHIFATDCKKGLPGRGLKFLKAVKQGTQIPVYAIGGICADNIKEIKETGADGACIMSGFMRCADVKEFIYALHRN